MTEIEDRHKAPLPAEDRERQVWAQPLGEWLDRVVEVPRQSDLFEESGW